MTSLPLADSLSALRAQLGAQLRARAATLAREVRDYPTPIARCDDQLTGLLERRARAFHALDAIEALPAGEAAGGLAALEACAATLGADDLDPKFLSRWREALEALRADWRAARGGCGPADAWANDGGCAA